MNIKKLIVLLFIGGVAAALPFTIQTLQTFFGPDTIEVDVDTVSQRIISP